MRQMLGWGLAAALTITACKDEAPKRVSGTPIVKALSKDLYVAPSGEYVATLVDVAPAKDLGAPQDILLGSLTLAPVSGGSSRRVGRNVPNLPGKVLYSLDGKYIACLADFSVARNMGELRVTPTAGGDVETLADNATFFSFSPKGDRIAYVAGGDLFLKSLAGGEPQKLASSVSLFEYSPAGAGERILIKQTARSGGNLMLFDVASGRLTTLARGTGTFGFSPNGDAFAFQAAGLLIPGVLETGGAVSKDTKDAAGFYRVVGNAAPQRLSSEAVSDFKFAPEGSRIAWVTQSFGAAPVGDLYVAETGEAKKLAPRVNQFQFASDGTIVLTGAFDPQSHLGTLGIVPASGSLVELGRNVRQFTLSPKGRFLLYSQGINVKGTFTMALMAHRFGAPADEKPRQIDTGVFGYVVDRQEQRLAYKARCTEAGKACTLFVTELAQPGESIPLAQRVAAFEFAPAPNGLVVVTSQHEKKFSGVLLFSLGLVAAQPNPVIQVLDDQMNGDFVLAGANRDQIVYLVGEKNREGVYTTGLTPSSAEAAKK
jgi:hypothetical protein